MEKRYKSMQMFGARGIESFNEIVAKLPADKAAEHEKINEDYDLSPGTKTKQYYYTQQPYLVIVIEEFADLMVTDKSQVEPAVVRLAQKARAAGIHIILAMQSPRKEVVTGLIKTNIPGRISFKVTSSMDSRVILDETGAERLLARGDMLFISPGTSIPLRHHGPWLQDREISDVAQFWAKQAEPDYDAQIMKLFEGGAGEYNGGDENGFEEADKMDDRYDEILSWASTQKAISASSIQTHFSLGYPRASRLIQVFEKEGVVGPANGSKPRQVLINSYKD
jgi:S-DNA-T family DNA segregation ATPase FtsK/SpoIIIE